jgi:EmrB/QacA subfamily drug resistance transporter
VYAVYKPNIPAWTLILVGVTTFMLVLDLTVVTVALSAMQAGLHAGLSELQWVVDAYAIAIGVVLLPAATAGDRFGRRRVFRTGVTVFTLGSLACGLAPTGLTLDLARGFQGLGGAALMGTGAPLLAAAFPVRADRDRALGMYAAVSGSAIAIGPLIGGALTGAFGWRSIFLVNVPLGLLVLLASRTRLVDARDPSSPSLDWAGIGLLSAGLLALTVVLLRGAELGWTSGTSLGLEAGGMALLGGFLVVESRTRYPAVDLSLFTRRDYAANAVVALLVQGGLVGALTYLSLYLQNSLRISALGAGLRFLPFSLLAFAAPLAVVTLARRAPSRVLVLLSAGLGAVGLAMMTRLGPTDGWVILLPGLLMCGAAIGVNNTVVNQVALLAAPPERAGMATGTVNALKQIGLALGIAIFGVACRASGRRQSRLASADAIHAVLVAATITLALATVVAVLGLRRSLAVEVAGEQIGGKQRGDHELAEPGLILSGSPAVLADGEAIDLGVDQHREPIGRGSGRQVCS